MRVTNSHKMTVTDDMVTPQNFKKQTIYSNRKINMKQLTLLLATVLLVNLFATGKLLVQNDYYFPDAGSSDPALPAPEHFLGYVIGAHHTRYDRIVSYFHELAKLSARVSYQ